MSIFTKYISDPEELQNVAKDFHPYHLLPPLKELILISKLRNTEVHAYHAKKDSQTIGMAVFFRETNIIFGVPINTFKLVGRDYFDYNFFFCEDHYLTNFRKFIIKDAKRHKIDSIVFENTAFPISNKKSIRGKNSIFDTALESECEKFHTLLRKKSLKRHFNKINQEFNYSCEHKTSSFTKEDIEALAIIHKERWKYSDKKSAFLNEDRINLYLGHKDNKVLTIIRNNDDIIAIHYGMILGDTFLWHTPTINIKYLEYSPLEVLLFEVVKFCQKNDFSILDLGLGDEKYKNRFSNSYRGIYHQTIRLTPKGFLHSCLIRYLDTKKTRNHLTNFLRKINITRATYRKNEIIYYQSPSQTITENNILQDLRVNSLQIISDFVDLVEIFRRNQIEIKKYHYDRIKSGCIFLCLMEKDLILSYGWATKQPTFFVSEINKNICNKGKMMLFNFVTPHKFRGKGYYTEFLRKIRNTFRKEKIVCFAEQKNIISNKGISRAGFLQTSYEII